jgi:hypothetical protein
MVLIPNLSFFDIMTILIFIYLIVIYLKRKSEIRSLADLYESHLKYEEHIRDDLYNLESWHKANKDALDTGELDKCYTFMARHNNKNFKETIATFKAAKLESRRLFSLLLIEQDESTLDLLRRLLKTRGIIFNNDFLILK